MADINMVVGQPHKIGILTLIDNVNSSAINAVFSNLSIQNSNPEFASFEASTDSNSVAGTGLTAGSGSVVISVHAVYVDGGDGLTHSDDLTITKTYQVSAAAHGSHLIVTF